MFRGEGSVEIEELSNLEAVFESKERAVDSVCELVDMVKMVFAFVNIPLLNAKGRLGRNVLVVNYKGERLLLLYYLLQFIVLVLKLL